MLRSIRIDRSPVGSLTSVLLAALISLGCGNSRAEDPAAGTKSDSSTVVQVTAGKTVLRDVPSEIQATGSLIADETSDIAPKTAGKIVNVYVNVGEFVGTGKIIARTDDKDARLRLAEAEARVNSSQSAVRQAEARLGLAPNGSFSSSAIPEVRAAGADYEQVLAELKQAEANEQRYRELVETGDVAMMTYEQYRTARDSYRARANAAKENLDTAVNTAKQFNQAIKSAEAAVETAKAEAATAKQAVADTVIRAPFAGFISDRQTAAGEYVTSSTTIAKLLRTDPIKIQIPVAEAELPQVLLGRGVSVQVDAYPERRFSGTITAVNPALDPASRSAVVEAKIENGDNALRSGMFALARIVREGESGGVFVPASAVYSHEATESYRVFVIEDGVAKLKVVQVGPKEDDEVRILSGLNADEVVATSNLDQLYEGAKVQVVQ